MRPKNKKLINGEPAYSLSAGETIPASFMLKASCQVTAAGGTPAGSLTCQVSNDEVEPVINWIDSGQTPVTMSSAGSKIMPQFDVCYNFVRFVFTPTGAGVQTITTVADVAGSLNSTYFFISAGALGVNYYVWLSNGTGVDPAIAGMTGVPVTYTNADTANTIADQVAAALDSLAAFVAPNPAANVITCTNATVGAFIVASDSEDAPTGFSFAVTAPTGTIDLIYHGYGA